MTESDFLKIYNDNKELVWRLVSRYVSSKDDKEDLFQEVFLNIYKALPKFRGQSKIETWIYRITINRSINYIKKQARHKKIKDIFEKVKHIYSKYSEDEEAKKQEVDLMLWKPLEKLNPKQRMILLLSEVEEMDLADIAKHLKMPIGTVKSNLHRAKNILRELLNKKVNSNG